MGYPCLSSKKCCTLIAVAIDSVTMSAYMMTWPFSKVGEGYYYISSLDGWFLPENCTIVEGYHPLGAGHQM